MLKTILIYCLLAFSTAEAATLRQTYQPDLHSLVVAIQCDDRADSQFVNVANEHNIKMSFALAKEILASGDSLAYHEYATRYAFSSGHEICAHDSMTQYGEKLQSGVFTLDSLVSRAVYNRSWIESLIGGNVKGFVMPNNASDDSLDIALMDEGFTYVRHHSSERPDLYLQIQGGESAATYPQVAGEVFQLSMIHKQAVPMLYASYVFPSGTIPQDAAASDTTGMWASVTAYLDGAAAVNGFFIWNIHPGGLDNGATDRYGSATRYDVSAWQLDYFLDICEAWDTANDDALCITTMTDLLANRHSNLRTDANTSLADCEANWSYTTAGPLYVDSALSQVTRYVDLEGTTPGNGTQQYPYPAAAWPRLFNCTIELSGDLDISTTTLNFPAANYTVHGNGATITTSATSASAIVLRPTQYDYVRNVRWEDLTLQCAATLTATNGAFNVGLNATSTDTTKLAADITLHNIDILGPKYCLNLNAVRRSTVEQCSLAVGDVLAGYGIKRSHNAGGYFTIRNNYFDLEEAVGSHASLAGWAIETSSVTSDTTFGSVVNNIFKIGEAQYVIRTHSGEIPDGIRFTRNAVDNSRSSDPDNWWLLSSTATAYSQFYDSLIVDGTTTDTLNFIASTITADSDTLKFGGWTGTGSTQSSANHASIGPVQWYANSDIHKIGTAGEFVTTPMALMPYLRLTGATGVEATMYSSRPEVDAMNLDIWLNGTHPNGSGTWEAQAQDTLKVARVR